MAIIGTVAFLLLVGVAMLARARLKERASYRQQMTDNALRSMGN
ncbi:inner membrane protein involved in colicin E2 resistance [Bradyrhizobium sp. USDA 4516]